MFQSWLFTLGSLVWVGLLLTVLERLFPFRTWNVKRENALDAFYIGLSFVNDFGWRILAGLLIGGLAARSFMHPVAAFHQWMERCPPLVGGLVLLGLADVLAYWAHRLNHTRWLWSTHAAHHSARHLSWTSRNRESPVHKVLIALPWTVAGMFGVVKGAFVPVMVVHAMMAHDAFIHSNIRVRSRLVTWVFMTGEHHFIHHATDPAIRESNFGFFFTFWDRLFGTYRDPRTVPRDFPLGLDYEVETWRLALGIPARRPAVATPAQPSKTGTED